MARRQASAPSASAPPPSTILLCAWVGAQPRHVAKYVSGYAALYPSAQIITVPSAVTDILLPTILARRRTIAFAMKAFLADPEQRLLVAAMSNGGLDALHWIARQYKEQTGQPLPAKAVVFDSAPGKVTFKGAIRAMTASLPQQAVLYWTAYLLVLTFLSALFIDHAITGRKNRVDLLRDGLNDPEVVSLDGERMYIFSETDDLVAKKDVLSHAKEAEGKGWRVRSEEWMESRHVAHMLVDEKRYWGLVRDCWEGRSSGPID